ncbi:uncharacterized protein LOC133961256 isoform X2 [Platichthys flesus]|uniref:uncharacterized protein LOC133961256 isoform X2 n=1 Tax=Platichthys flesus TaxID=8260 RepID=UPI002DB63DBF|nr:uncharacterized protein LOC133961256 isoform X2 [Platichthys flesus]
MVDNIVRKPIGLVLLATALIVFSGPSQGKLNGTLGSSVTFRFEFNDAVINERSHLAVYKKDHKKIAEHLGHKGNLGGGVFVFNQNHSVWYHIKKLKQNDSGFYWASLFVDSRTRNSKEVQLCVQDGNRSVEVSPQPINITNAGSPGPLSLHLIPVLLAPVVLLAAALPLLIWFVVRTKEKQQQPQQNSNSTVQETVAGSSTGPPPSLIYSVLDFAKRPPAALDTKPNDTEYAAVSYLTEKRRM